MKATNIKELLELKKNGEKILFMDCPVCHCFFGTDQWNEETCSKECNIKLVQGKIEFEIYGKNHAFIISKKRPSLS